MKLLKNVNDESEISQFVMWPGLPANQKAWFSQISQILRENHETSPKKTHLKSIAVEQLC